MTNSRDKGKRYELEIARECREHGFDARRTAQYCGNTGDAADVIGLPGIHIECKRAEKLNIDDALQQAIRDSKGTGLLPAVFHRKNNTPSKVTMLLEDWWKLYHPFSEDYISEEEFAQYMNPPEEPEDGKE